MIVAYQSEAVHAARLDTLHAIVEIDCEIVMEAVAKKQFMGNTTSCIIYGASLARCTT